MKADVAYLLYQKVYLAVSTNKDSERFQKIQRYDRRYGGLKADVAYLLILKIRVDTKP